MVQERSEGDITRRTALAFAGLTALIASLGQDFLRPLAALAAGPTSAAAAADLANAQIGKTLAQLQSSVMTDGQWHTYANDWCAVFASWVLRGTNATYEPSSYALYSQLTPVSTPAVGDLIYYPNPGHTGIVVGVTNGVAQTVEGNVPGNLSWQNTWVKSYSAPWRNDVLFARPVYSNQGDLDMTAVDEVMGHIYNWRRNIDGQDRNILEALDHITFLLTVNANRREEINARDEISRQEQTTQGAQLLAAIQALGTSS